MFCCLGREAGPLAERARPADDEGLRRARRLRDQPRTRGQKAGEDKLRRISDGSTAADRHGRLPADLACAHGISPSGWNAWPAFPPSPRTPDLWFKEAADSRPRRRARTRRDPDGARGLARFRRGLSRRERLARDDPEPRILRRLGGCQPTGSSWKSPNMLMSTITTVCSRRSRPFAARGVRLAVDDAGAGYSSLQHILHLRPDLIKLDMGLTRHIDVDPARRALASALIDFARDTGSQIIAEGVETASEFDTLRARGRKGARLFPRPADAAGQGRRAFRCADFLSSTGCIA